MKTPEQIQDSIDLLTDGLVLTFTQREHLTKLFEVLDLLDGHPKQLLTCVILRYVMNLFDGARG
jgi:hypothetical protein